MTSLFSFVDFLSRIKEIITSLAIQYLAATSPTSPGSPAADFNRSVIQQRSLFGSNNQDTPTHTNYSNVPPMSHNATPSGPPTQASDVLSILFDSIFLWESDLIVLFSISQSLFDSLRVEQNSVMDNSYIQKQQAQRQINQNQSFAMNQSVCDSYLNQSNFNVSR